MRALLLASLALLAFTPGTVFAQDSRLEPTLGLINVNAGYRIGVYEGSMIAGGPIYANDTVGCEGFIPAAPHLSLDSQGGHLRIGVQASDWRSELTLIIQGPNGWSCTDDRMGGGTEMNFENTMPGRYFVWIGTYEPNGNIPAVIYADDEPEYFGWR